MLQVQNLKGFYKGSFGTVYAVDGVSLTIKSGEILGLVGESGCGKSTLAKLILGTKVPYLYRAEGKVFIEGHDIYNMSPEKLRKHVLCKFVSWVPQSSLNSLNPTLRLKNFVAEMLRERTGKKYNPEEVKKMLAEYFRALGLDEHVLDLYPHELSGGMRQRAIIAISSFVKPSLYILDEPTSALDVFSQKLLIKMLFEIYQRGMIKSALYISHDISTLRQICNNIAVMYAGKLVEYGGTENLVKDPLHPYTKALIFSSLPLEQWIKHERDKFREIKGRPPDLRNPPPGCRFHTRCPNAISGLCDSEEPPFINVRGRFISCWLYKEGA